MANWADGGGSTRMLWTGQMGLITRRSWVQIPPPPLRETSSTAESPRCRGLSCCFSVLPGVNHRFIGTFFGTYSTLAYAAYARCARREWPARCTFATEVRTGLGMHGAAVYMPYAVALLNLCE